jgi:polysaccharide biosynthesis transport protein
MNDRTFPSSMQLSLQNGLVPPGNMGSNHPAEESTLDLVEYWRSITKRKWSIFGLVLLTTLIAILVVHAIQPIFRSTVTILIEQSKAKVVSIEEVYNSIGTNREYFQTQIEIIKSRELARKVVEKLNLSAHPEFAIRAKSGLLASFLPDALLSEQASLSNEEQLKLVVRKFSTKLQVQPVRNSQLVQISFVSTDKALAASVPNVLADMAHWADGRVTR